MIESNPPDVETVLENVIAGDEKYHYTDIINQITELATGKPKAGVVFYLTMKSASHLAFELKSAYFDKDLNPLSREEFHEVLGEAKSL